MTSEKIIPPDKRIIDFTWSEFIAALDERYGPILNKPRELPFHPIKGDFMNIEECAAVTGYKANYIRQLVFKRQIPFYKHPKLKPIRFKRSELIEWMTGKKHIPTNDLAETYINSKK